MTNLPKNIDEFERAVEAGKQNISGSVSKTISGVSHEIGNQLAPSNEQVVNFLYGVPDAKKQQSSTGTASIGEQLTPKPGELVGAVSGSVKPPGEKNQTESITEQLIPAAATFIGGLAGSPQQSGENPPTEGLEQLLPTVPQIISAGVGSPQTARETPSIKMGSGAILPSPGEFIGDLSGSLQGGGKSLPEDHTTQQVAMNQKVNPDMQAFAQEKTSEEQKEKHEIKAQHMRNYGHDYELDSLEQQVAKLKQQKQQEEQQKLQEEEEEKKRKKEEEEQQRQQLVEPSGKLKPGQQKKSAADFEKTKTESNRGARG